MGDFDLLYWSVIGAAWGWIIGSLVPLIAPAIQAEWRRSRLGRSLAMRRFNKRYGEHTPNASLIAAGTAMAEVSRATGLTAAEAAEAFGRLR